MSIAASRVFAAVAVSGAVHAGAALFGWSVQSTAVDGAVGSTPLRVTIGAPSPKPVVSIPKAASPVVMQPVAERIALAGAPKVAAAPRPAPPAVIVEPTDADPVDEASSESVRVESPTPISYPVFTLPENDDPHRIGLTRLLLVVSSQGQTIDVIVTASTMSQDYVDSLVKTFSAMRFEPARVRGLPYPGTYEVVVNFAYEPNGRAAL